MYSAIMLLPVSSVRSKSDIRPDHAVRRYRKWQALCAASTTSRKTNSRRQTTDLTALSSDKEDRHLQSRDELHHVQLRYFGPHRVERETEATCGWRALTV